MLIGVFYFFRILLNQKFPQLPLYVQHFIAKNKSDISCNNALQFRDTSNFEKLKVLPKHGFKTDEKKKNVASALVSLQKGRSKNKNTPKDRMVDLEL